MTMHHHGHFGGGPWARRRGFMRPFPAREELIERLESYQRDLEQELANLDDVLRHLRGSGGEAPQEG
ncbi:MAG: hypothetical protein JOZ56_07935 [Actinobacteria bacterium]|nr:hypothetical protein [Actinomycetota bacterium]